MSNYFTRGELEAGMFMKIERSDDGEIMEFHGFVKRDAMTSLVSDHKALTAISEAFALPDSPYWLYALALIFNRYARRQGRKSRFEG